ncbi:putative conserved membrane protein [Aspergillus campestris IBT 28561]|uniref:Conserved membrane protein n=1 Tax=Aspergillus campestris (strain IBT 28561) TaxID=1392248 RepID=A0A2I1CYE6_ASPC2|nr:putative conserved membrane protein [Aspergillus campestris IBT 28561]PKY02641.1 putative conserved membrane protein [Aspergillus campestris IBT 28561]
MSLCRATMRPPVTSSATMLGFARKTSTGTPTRSLRLFSSYGNSYRSSKRDMQTATAYRPHSLPSSFPPPRANGGSDTISADFPPTRETTFQQKPEQRSDSSTVKPSESEPQKQTSAEPATTAPKATGKPRRKLRPRKAALKVTPLAIEQLRKLVSQPDPKFIRVGVKNRGCSGLAYHLEYVEKPGAFDEVVEQDGVKVLIDSKALFSIIGSEMDWQEDKLSRRFVFRNPNINSSIRLDQKPHGDPHTPSPHEPKMTSPHIQTPSPSLKDNDPTPPSDTLFLVIRFSASLPDLPLEVYSPETTTAAGLKQLIRTRLPPDLSSHRLRLIYAGRGLEDTRPLSVTLRLPPPPLSMRARLSPDDDSNGSANDKGKGKQPVREPPRLYIHCSIGDIVLSAVDLAAEAAVASTLQKQKQAQSQSQPGGDNDAADDQQRSTTTPAPRGFDRLLSAGFTPADVSMLRSQFMAIQSVSRTPDTMPSGAELRELEDRWMDEGSSPMANATGTGGDGGVAFADDDGGFGSGSHGAIDDMLWGAVMGFFWPVGCAMWLRREEGIWSWRKGLAVFVGIVVNMAFGAMRVMG